jgi:hypothetical protein
VKGRCAISFACLCFFLASAPFAKTLQTDKHGNSDDRHAAGQDGYVWRQVTNHIGFVDIPVSLFNRVDEAADIEFIGKKDNSKIRFTTITEPRLDFPGHNPKEDMALERSDCDHWPPEYLSINEKIAAYSCKKGAVISYYLAKYNKSGMVSIYVEYPIEKKDVWSGIIKRMAASLRQVERTESVIEK